MIAEQGREAANDDEVSRSWLRLSLPACEFRSLVDDASGDGRAYYSPPEQEIAWLVHGNGVAMRIGSFEDAACLASVLLEVAVKLRKTDAQRVHLDAILASAASAPRRMEVTINAPPESLASDEFVQAVTGAVERALEQRAGASHA